MMRAFTVPSVVKFGVIVLYGDSTTLRKSDVLGFFEFEPDEHIRRNLPSFNSLTRFGTLSTLFLRR